jgi:hypothetical protein
LLIKKFITNNKNTKKLLLVLGLFVGCERGFSTSPVFGAKALAVWVVVLSFYLIKRVKSIFIHTFFLTKKYAKTQGRTKLLRSRPLRWPAVLPGLAFLFFFFFCHPELVEGCVWFGMVVYLFAWSKRVRNLFLFILLLDQKEAKPTEGSS